MLARRMEIWYKRGQYFLAMKLRLPRHLVLAFVLAGGALPGAAAIRHSDVSLNTYVDFATNSGRYVTGATNELLEYIRSFGFENMTTMEFVKEFYT